MGAGRPRAYENAKSLEQAAAGYMEENQGKLTITGLALALGFESRQSFYDYEKDGEFSYTIKKLRLTIEAGYESKLHENGCTGAIFALKNFGWSDKTEQDLKVEGGINVVFKKVNGG
jgi:hypothetical protein